MHTWKRGDEAWCRYYLHAIDGYEAKLAGHVTGVGRVGVTIRRTKPDHEGKLVMRLGFRDVWPSKEATDAAIAIHPRPSFPRAPGT